MKVGQVLFEVGAEDGTGKISWDEWIVRTIRGGKIHATMKIHTVTWGKRSKKNGDFGWLDPIAPAWRKSWRVGQEIPEWYGLATTRQGALRKSIASQKKYGSDDDYDTPGKNEQIIKRLEIMLKHERGKK